MLAESARACLAVVMDRNDLAPVLFDNLTREQFPGAAMIVFDAMQDLSADGMDLHWSTVKDAVGPKVNSGFWQLLMDSTRGLHSGGAEAFLREKVNAIKTEHGKRKLLAEIEHVVAKPNVDDEDIDELEKTAQSMRLIDRPKEQTSLQSALTAYQEHIRKEASDIILGLPTLDRQIDGFNAGEVVVIMARPGVGKTFWALNLIDHLAGRCPFKIALFSLEMPKAAVIERLLEIHFGIGRRELKAKALEGELEMAGFEERFAQLSIYDKIYSVSEIRKIVEREGFRAIFVDFMHLVRPEVVGSPYQQISQVMSHLKQMAKDTGCVAFLLHQLSRKAGSGYTKVEADHARDAGTIEELADFLIGVWAPGLSPEAPREMDEVLSVALLKNKRGGHWCYDIRFDKTCGRIAEEDEDGRDRHETQARGRGLHDWTEPRSETD